MLGKQITRVGSFTMCHAIVLVVALGAAGWINPILKDAALTTKPVSADTVVSSETVTYRVIRATVVYMLDCDKSAKNVDA